MLSFEIDIESNLQEKQENTLKQEVTMYVQAITNIYRNKPTKKPQIGSLPLILDKYALERIILLYQLLQLGVLPAYKLILNILRVYTLEADTISDNTKQEILEIIHRHAII